MNFARSWKISKIDEEAWAMMKTVYSANDEDRTDIVNRLAAALAHEPNIAFAYLYGSFVESWAEA